jgi:CheY-like chemotaxis protein
VTHAPRPRRILVVEDDSAIREAISEVLTELGYQVVLATNGQDGLRLAAEMPEPCPVLLDWRMPVLDGPTFLARLRQLPRGGEFPVILSTADQSAADAARGNDMAGVLAKPFDLDELLRLLERVSGA